MPLCSVVLPRYPDRSVRGVSCENGVTAMRYRSERRPGGYWVFDTFTAELCFATFSHDQKVAEKWADTLNAAYSAFRDEAQLKSLCSHVEQLADRRRPIGRRKADDPSSDKTIMTRVAPPAMPSITRRQG